MKFDATAIHAALGSEGWRTALVGCGIGEQFLKNKHGPCPVCGGRDRFRFDNKGRGAFFCNQCGAGDGFKLVMRVHGFQFAEARKKVLAAAGLIDGCEWVPPQARPQDETIERAEPTVRVRRLLRECCAIENCEPAIRYLQSRMLWPLPEGHTLRAHPSVEYWEDRQRIGRYPALVAEIRDLCSELVTAHVTYLTPDGQKLGGYEPRKILSVMTGREGCVAQIMLRDGDTLGIAEGIETALSAAKLTGIPCWSAINRSLLQKFEPPHDLSKLVIFADRDVPGLEAAAKLMERLQEKLRLEIRTPQFKDFNDVLRGKPQ